MASKGFSLFSGLPLCLVLCWAFQAFAAGCSAPPKAPVVVVDLQVTQPGVEHGRLRRELKQFDISTVSPYGVGQQVHVNGLMRGAISLATQSAIAWQRSAFGDQNCFWFDHITVALKLSPTIYVAHEIPEQSCLYNEVLMHEQRHFNTDAQIARDLQYTLKSEIDAMLARTGVLGPFSSQMQDSTRNEMMQRLSQVINGVNDRMKAERTRRQALIDTMQEYERVARACPGEQHLM